MAKDKKEGLTNSIINHVKSVGKRVVASTLVAGAMVTGATGCAKKPSEDESVKRPEDVTIPGSGVVEEIVTSTECLNEIDEFVKNHFNLSSCEVQAIATQKEENGALSVSNHNGYRGKDSFEAVDFIFQIKANGKDKMHVVVVPVPTSVYFNPAFEGIQDGTYNVSLTRDEIKNMDNDNLKGLNDMFEATTHYYGSNKQSNNDMVK